MKAVLGLMLALAASPAVAADQFDLICKGEDKGYSPAPAAAHYRIDLKLRSWCNDDCKEVYSLADVAPGRITLSDLGPGGETQGSIYIDRSTGAWRYFSADRTTILVDITGSCSPGAFSGFPAAKF